MMTSRFGDDYNPNGPDRGRFECREDFERRRREEEAAAEIRRRQEEEENREAHT